MADILAEISLNVIFINIASQFQKGCCFTPFVDSLSLLTGLRDIRKLQTIHKILQSIHVSVLTARRIFGLAYEDLCVDNVRPSTGILRCYSVTRTQETLDYVQSLLNSFLDILKLKISCPFQRADVVSHTYKSEQ